MGLQDRPGEDVPLPVEVGRVAGVVALEPGGQPEHEEVGPGHDRDDGAVARVGALAAPPLAEAAVARPVALGRREAAPVEQGEPVAAELAHDAHLVAVLEVRADAGQVEPDRDPVRLELLARADPGELQELRRREGAAGQDHLAADEHAASSRRPTARETPGAGRRRRRAAHRGTRRPPRSSRRRRRGHESQARASARPGCRAAPPPSRWMCSRVPLRRPFAVASGTSHSPRRLRPGDPPVVRVEPGAQVAVVVLDAREPLDRAPQLGPGGRQDLAEQRRIVQRDGGVRQAGREPAAVSVPAPVAEEPLPPVHVPVPLEPLEVAPHRLAAPGGVVELGGDRVPVGARPGDRDHRVVGGAAAQRPGPRVPDAAPLGDELGIAPDRAPRRSSGARSSPSAAPRPRSPRRGTPAPSSRSSRRRRPPRGAGRASRPGRG